MAIARSDNGTPRVNRFNPAGIYRRVHLPPCPSIHPFNNPSSIETTASITIYESKVHEGEGGRGRKSTTVVCRCWPAIDSSLSLFHWVREGEFNAAQFKGNRSFVKFLARHVQWFTVIYNPGKSWATIV